MQTLFFLIRYAKNQDWIVLQILLQIHNIDSNA